MNDAHVLTFAGELDLSRKQVIARELERIERFGPQAVTILDLTRVTYLDSTFFNALVHVQKNAFNAPPSGRICVVLRRAYGYRLFQVAKLDQMFPLFEDLAAAYEYVAAKFPNTDAAPENVEPPDIYRVTRSAPTPIDTNAGLPGEWQYDQIGLHLPSSSPDPPEETNQGR